MSAQPAGSSPATHVPREGIEVADQVTGLFAGLLADLDVLAAEVERELAVEAPRRADLDLEERCGALLTDPVRKVAGAGLVLAPDVLADAPYWLEWWTVNPDAAPPVPRRLAAETDPRAVGFRDYTHLPWYAVPERTGRPHVTGPYIDYLCTDQQTLTFTRPVTRHGGFAGVVGFDLLVRTFEERMLDPVERVPGSCAVINTTGRVVTSSDERWMTGDLIRDLPVEEWFAGEPAGHPEWAFLPCPGVPLGVVVTPLA
ncbi:MAG TPA: cache domain-containing protein [Pedococcus sp.]